MSSADNEKKQVPLRLNKKLWEALSSWAEDDFRSLNGQIEFLLSECVKRCNKSIEDGTSQVTTHKK